MYFLLLQCWSNYFETSYLPSLGQSTVYPQVDKIARTDFDQNLKILFSSICTVIGFLQIKQESRASLR